MQTSKKLYIPLGLFCKKETRDWIVPVSKRLNLFQLSTCHKSVLNPSNATDFEPTSHLTLHCQSSAWFSSCVKKPRIHCILSISPASKSTCAHGVCWRREGLDGVSWKFNTKNKTMLNHKENMQNVQTAALCQNNKWWDVTERPYYSVFISLHRYESFHITFSSIQVIERLKK